MDSAGMMMYMGQNFTGGPSFLSGLEDVNIKNPADNQILILDNGVWKNHTITAADVQYDSNNTVEDEISALSNRIDAHTRGTAVILTSYTTSSNQYTFPSDGYILAKSGDNANDYITIRVANIIDLTAKTQQTNYTEGNCLYVKKGMKCYILAKSGTANVANFYPITSGL